MLLNSVKIYLTISSPSNRLFDYGTNVSTSYWCAENLDSFLRDRRCNNEVKKKNK